MLFPGTASISRMVARREGGGGGGGKSSGGSALTRLKQNLKQIGVVGPGSRHSQSKKQRKAAILQSGFQAIADQKRSASSALRSFNRDREDNNLFEQKFNRQKFDVLGRQAKGVQGRPTMARTKDTERVIFFFSFSSLLCFHITEKILTAKEDAGGDKSQPTSHWRFQRPAVWRGRSKHDGRGQDAGAFRP